MSAIAEVRVRRVYDEPEESDGARVLVDRIWPRGMTKVRAGLTEWCKDVAPSTELRKWYSHDPAKFEEFTRRYGAELEQAERAQVLQHLLLAAAPQGGHDSFRTQEIKQRHGFQPFLSPARRAGQPWDLDNQVPSLGSAIRTGTADTVSQFLQASGQGILSAPRSRPSGGSIR